MLKHLTELIAFSNSNAGFISVIVFFVTLIIGWFSGVFSAIRKKPKFKIETIEGATFYSIIALKKSHNGLPVHKTAFVIYLSITNTGNSPSNVGKIKLGFRRDDKKLFFLSKRVWVRETILKSDVFIDFSNSTFSKCFPFLKQKNRNMQNSIDLYLEIGKNETCIVYFEVAEAYGNWYPRETKRGRETEVLIQIEDSYGHIHKKKVNIEYVEFEKALQQVPHFGQSYTEYSIDDIKL